MPWMCDVCGQLVDESVVIDPGSTAWLFESSAFAVCPVCHQEVPVQSHRYRRAWERLAKIAAKKEKAGRRLKLPALTMSKLTRGRLEVAADELALELVRHVAASAGELYGEDQRLAEEQEMSRALLVWQLFLCRLAASKGASTAVCTRLLPRAGEAAARLLSIADMQTEGHDAVRATDEYEKVRTEDPVANPTVPVVLRRLSAVAVQRIPGLDAVDEAPRLVAELAAAAVVDYHAAFERFRNAGLR